MVGLVGGSWFSGVEGGQCAHVQGRHQYLQKWWRKTVNDNLEEFMGIGEVGDFEKWNGLIAWKFRFRFIMTHAYGEHQVMIFYVEI